MKTRSAQIDPSVSSDHREIVRRSPRLDVLLAFVIAVFLATTAGPVFSRRPATPQASPSALVQNVKCLIGLENIKTNTRGTLTLQPAGLEFAAGNKKIDISTASIQDIFTGQESRQDVSGMQGALVKAAIPYEGGRTVSLFSHKVEVLTVEYSDSTGGFHGAIFVLGAGKATLFKNQLVAQGAKVNTHLESPEPKEQNP